MQRESDELSQSILTLNGVGEKTAALFEQINVKSVFDLLSTIPKSFSDKSEIESINDAEDGDNIVVSGEIVKAVRTKGFRSNFILTVKGDSGSFSVRFIHKIIIFMNLRIGMKIRVEGRALRKSKAVHGSVYAFFPDSFILPTEYTKFVHRYAEQEKAEIWICKPDGSSRGRGIFLIKDLNDLHYENDSKYASRS